MSRVLIVDDEPAVRQVAGIAFELDGFEVAYAGDGAEAIAQIELCSPDVLLLDIMMPRVDGLTALRHLRQHPVTADLAVVLLSAKAGSADIAIGMLAGADDYITKPFNTDDLVARVSKVLDAPPEERPHRQANLVSSRCVPVPRPPSPSRLEPKSGRSTRHGAGVDLRRATRTAMGAAGLATPFALAASLGLARLSGAGSWAAGVSMGAMVITAAVVAGFISYARSSRLRSADEALERRLARATTGTGIGAHAVTATARVCQTPDEALRRVNLGDILVVHKLTSDYTAVAALAIGIVSEEDGPHSHLALIAHELGIVAIVGAAGACTSLHDGERVVLDPIAGTASLAGGSGHELPLASGRPMGDR